MSLCLLKLVHNNNAREFLSRRSSKGDLKYIMPLALLTGITSSRLNFRFSVLFSMSYTYQNSWRLSLVKLKRFYDNSNATDAHTLTFTMLNEQHLSLSISHSHSLLTTISLFAGNLILHTKMAVEILGGWQDSCAHHGLRYRHLFRSREKTKKEITFRLFMGKFKVSLH